MRASGERYAAIHAAIRPCAASDPARRCGATKRENIARARRMAKARTELTVQQPARLNGSRAEAPADLYHVVFGPVHMTQIKIGITEYEACVTLKVHE